MTLTDFIAKYNGKYIDFDGVYGAQCMDLMHQYVVEVLGIADPNVLSAPAAVDLYNNFDNIYGHEDFDLIANTVNNVPLEGDIIVWDIYTYGHVAIFVDGDPDKFNSFDQNYPIGSPCHLQNHDYNGVSGWFHPKGVMVEVPSQTFENLVRKSTIYDKVCTSLGVGDNETVVLAEIEKLKTCEQGIIDKDKQLNDAQTKIADMDKQLKDLQDQHAILVDENSKLSEEATTQKKTIQDQGFQISQLSVQIDELKKITSVDSLNGWQLIIKGISKLFG